MNQTKLTFILYWFNMWIFYVVYSSLDIRNWPESGKMQPRRPGVTEEHRSWIKYLFHMKNTHNNSKVTGSYSTLMHMLTHWLTLCPWWIKSLLWPYFTNEETSLKNISAAKMKPLLKDSWVSNLDIFDPEHIFLTTCVCIHSYHGCAT